ncbi:YrhK family protein [Virgibacillus siamensis]|uniref:YrhK family protein n=1 Tax=Virgibacillus siamensis TaxID=480071 RepID=UPI0009840E55|nr:YrhK family protein [Virgibacillus siamensis]
MRFIEDEEKFLDIHVGTFELSFSKKYRYIALINDLTLGLEFLIGSAFFLYEPLKTAGVILFIIGSAQLLARPIIKIMHAIHFSHIKNEQSKKSQ